MSPSFLLYNSFATHDFVAKPWQSLAIRLFTFALHSHTTALNLYLNNIYYLWADTCFITFKHFRKNLTAHCALWIHASLHLSISEKFWQHVVRRSKLGKTAQFDLAHEKILCKIRGTCCDNLRSLSKMPTCSKTGSNNGSPLLEPQV